MNIGIPFLQSANANDEGTFSTHLNAILIRESSQAECYQYWDQRAAALKQLPSGKAGQFYDSSKYVRMEDNGC